MTLRCRALGVRCVAVAGCVQPGLAGREFAEVQALTPDLTTAERALREGAVWVAAAAERLGRRMDAAGGLAYPVRVP